MNKLNEIVDESKVIYREECHIYSIFPLMFIEDLKWHQDDGLEYLTLKEIREQLPKGMIRVICDSGLNGYIYEIGNYPNEEKWRLYGITKGYA